MKKDAKLAAREVTRNTHRCVVMYVGPTGKRRIMADQWGACERMTGR